MKCDGTRAETRFRLLAKRTSPFKSAGASVQSTTGSRRLRISGSNAGYTMFQGNVKSTGYPLHSSVSPSLLPLVLRRVPSHFNWSLTLNDIYPLFQVRPHLELTFENILSHINTVYVLKTKPGVMEAEHRDVTQEFSYLRLKVSRY